MTARAGWFPDPAGRPDHFRWWDGSAWTRFLTSDPTAPEPALIEQPVASSGGDQGSTSQIGRHAATDPTPWQQAGAVVAQPSIASQADAAAGAPTVAPVNPGNRPPGYERPARRAAGPPRTSLKAALLGIGAVVVIAGIVLAITLYGNPAPTGLQPPPDDNPSLPVESPSPTPPESSSFDPATRQFSLDGLEMTMPDVPYELNSGNTSMLGGPGVNGTATVHPHYDGAGSAWTATVVAGQVGEDLVGKDLNDTADKIISNWAATEFGDSPAKIKKEKQSTITKNLPRPARIITADMHYSVKGVKSKYDHVSLLVSKGPSGDYVAFLSSRPNDASPKIKSALDAAVNTVHLV